MKKTFSDQVDFVCELPEAGTIRSLADDAAEIDNEIEKLKWKIKMLSSDGRALVRRARSEAIRHGWTPAQIEQAQADADLRRPFKESSK
jgi:hypothetical protein